VGNPVANFVTMVDLVHLTTTIVTLSMLIFWVLTTFGRVSR
jgi:hypothetical protein